MIHRYTRNTQTFIYKKNNILNRNKKITKKTQKKIGGKNHDLYQKTKLKRN